MDGLLGNFSGYRTWRGGYWYQVTGYIWGKRWVRCIVPQGGRCLCGHPKHTHWSDDTGCFFCDECSGFEERAV